MKKFLVVFGTRPEALKMIPLILELQKVSKINTKVCVTAQHREMLDQVLSIFDVIPDYDLNLMKSGQSLSKLNARILIEFENVLNDFKPDLVFVHGDTTTSFAVSLSCFYSKINIAHIEAGLRTFDLNSPWPEEFNRQITSKISLIHYSPTVKSKSNLLNEKIDDSKIIVTGNTIIDTLFLSLQKISENKTLEYKIIKNFNSNYKINLDKKIILITAHRRENFGIGFENICEAILELSNIYTDIQFVIPVHLNPNVSNVVNKLLSNKKNIFLIKPLDYLSFIYLMEKSFLILTDSGGVQEEAPSLNIPVLVLRNNTERPEALEFGKVKLVGTDKKLIIKETCRILNDKEYYNSFLTNSNPFGDGTASKKIINHLKNEFLLDEKQEF